MGFFKTVAVVTVFSVCEKFLGFLYRIFLSRTIGAEGIGLYQVALSVFALLLTICSSGTPITVSRLMTKYRAENREDKVKKIVTAGLVITLLTALPLCIFFFVFKGTLPIIFADERSANIFLVVLPGLVFTSVYAVLRGVFWGNKDFLPYSIIELLEEICMIFVGVFLISRATTAYQGAFRAGVAVLVSYVFSFSLATLVFIIRKNRLKNPKTELKPLLASAMPVTAMRTANSFIASLVSIILPMRLISSGYTESVAISAFGAAAGQALPILFIPTTIIGSFTLVLVPEISENYYAKRNLSLKTNIEKAIKTSVLIASFCLPVFFVMGTEIGVMFFGNADSGKFLSYSAFLMLFMSLSSITTSILNSIGLETKTLVYYIIGAVLMLISVYVLPSFMGIYSLIVGYAFVFVITTAFNLRLISKKSPIKIEYGRFSVLSVIFIVLTSVFGLLLKGVLLKLLGPILTIMAVGIILVAFIGVLFLAFDLVSIQAFKQKVFSIFKRKRLTQ